MSKNSDIQKGKVHKPRKPTKRGNGKKNQLSKSEKSRRLKNLTHGYSADYALKSPGPTRKFYLNRSHALLQSELDAARTAGDKALVAKNELLLARSVVANDRLLREPKLIESAFVPYRYQSPWERTEKFARKFDQIYREYKERYFGETIEAPSREALSLWPDGDIVAMWSARQSADKLGIPYEFYIRTAFDFRFSSGYKGCPKPGQLWHGDKITEHMKKEFDARGGNAAQRGYNIAVIDPMFFAENFRDDPIQQAAHADLYEKVKSFPDSFKLGAILKSSRILTEAGARKHFGDALVDRMQEHYEPFSVREASVPLTAEQAPLLGCFGGYDASATGCTRCPARVKCRALQTEVDALLLSEYGSTSPRKAAATKAATLRKQRQRARAQLDRATAALAGESNEADGASVASPKPKPKPKPKP